MKTITSINDLSVCGASPAFAEKLHVGRPNIGDRERMFARLNDMLDRRWLTNNGPFVQEFQQRIAHVCGVKHCIAVCNATIGIEILARALDLRGEVIIPSFSAPATAHALQWLGITPVFCDVDSQTHNMDPRQVAALITPRTAGIMGVHIWGHACEVDSLSAITQQHKLKLMFDAAHAFACSYGERMIGNFGAAEVFSFHATKFLNSFEGGAIATNDDALADRIRLMINFGFRGYDNVLELGTNGKMNEASAVMGLTNLDSMDDFIAINHRHYCQYERELRDVPGLTFYHYPAGNRYNYHYVVLELDAAAAGIHRDELVQVLHAENILARRYFHPGCHRMAPYRTLYPAAGAHLPVTERLTERVFALPNGTAIDSEVVSQICQIIRFTAAHGAEIHRRLSAGGQ